MFLWRNKKDINTFGLSNASHQELSYIITSKLASYKNSMVDVQKEPQSQPTNDTKRKSRQTMADSSLPRWLNWMCVQLVTKRLWVRPLSGGQQSSVESDHEIFSTGHLFPLISTVVSVWRKNVHNTG